MGFTLPKICERYPDSIRNNYTKCFQYLTSSTIWNSQKKREPKNGMTDKAMNQESIMSISWVKCHKKILSNSSLPQILTRIYNLQQFSTVGQKCKNPVFSLPVGSHHPGELKAGSNQECSIDSTWNFIIFSLCLSLGCIFWNQLLRWDNCSIFKYLYSINLPWFSVYKFGLGLP